LSDPSPRQRRRLDTIVAAVAAANQAAGMVAEEELPASFDDGWVALAHQLADAAARVTRNYFR
jgi:hypothetical protein